MSVVAVSGLLAGCSGLKSLIPDKLPSLPVDVKIALPPEVQAVIDDATAAVTKVESLGGNVMSLAGGAVAKVKELIGNLSSQQTLDAAKPIIGELVKGLGTVAGLLPPPWGTIALAIETVIPLIGNVAGLRLAARRPTGMSPAQARAILRS